MIVPAKRMSRLLATALAVVTAIVCLVGAPRDGAAAPRAPIGGTPANAPVPPELAGIGIDDRAGSDMPRDVTLTDQDSKRVRLGDYFDGKRPVVLVLAYYQCPMLCSLVLKGVLDGMKEIRWTAGQEYRVLVLSFDPRDTTESAAAKRLNHIEAYHREVTNRGWDFLIGDQATVKTVADAVGFKYRWDARDEQFAHAAGAFVITPSGRISRTMYGMSFPEMRLALLEASEGKMGTVGDKVLLFCFHYDPVAGGYVLATLRLMKAGGALTVLLLSLFLFRFWRVERRRRRDGDSPAPGPGDLLPERRS